MSCRAGRVDINVLTKIKSIKYSGNVVSRAHYHLLAREDLVDNVHVGPVRRYWQLHTNGFLRIFSNTCTNKLQM